VAEGNLHSLTPAGAKGRVHGEGNLRGFAARCELPLSPRPSALPGSPRLPGNDSGNQRYSESDTDGTNP